MLNHQTSHAASPLLQEVDERVGTSFDEDRRVEIAAARHTALDIAFSNRGQASTPDDIVKEAALFEAFLADHPANGAKSLSAALGFSRFSGETQVGVIIRTARTFAAYLDNGHTDAA